LSSAHEGADAHCIGWRPEAATRVTPHSEWRAARTDQSCLPSTRASWISLQVPGILASTPVRTLSVESSRESRKVGLDKWNASFLSKSQNNNGILLRNKISSGPASMCAERSFHAYMIFHTKRNPMQSPQYLV
jgi:hypothetical protein